MPLAEAAQIITAVAEALSFAHHYGVVQRDVKPANIMQTCDSRVVLTDFGIATVLHETRLTVRRHQRHSLLYVAGAGFGRAHQRDAALSLVYQPKIAAGH